MDQISAKMKSLRLPGMATCWTNLLETHRTESTSLADGLQLLLQAECEQRENNKQQRLLRNAQFRYHATIETMAFDVKRGLDRERIMRLATCDYIEKGIPIIITGPSGTGKSYLSSALGHQACMCRYSVYYQSTLKLFSTIGIARIESTAPRLFSKIGNTDLLILDDFGLQPLKGQQLLDLLEILEDRHGRKSTIFVSQLPVSKWYDILSQNATAADAILDRIVHSAIRFELIGESMRKKKDAATTQ